MTGFPITFRIERTFDAPAQAVFDAWTSVEVLTRWWHPGVDWSTPHVEVDLRVGGRVRAVLRDPEDHRDYGGGGEYTEIRPPERLVFTWTWDDDPPGQSSLIEVDFRERDGATTVVFTQSGIPSEESRNSQRAGWEAALDNLGRVFMP